MKTCPYCAEKIRNEAVVCRFCGRELPNPEQISISQTSSEENLSTSQDPASRSKKWLIIITIVASLNVLALCFCSGFLTFIAGAAVMDGSSEFAGEIVKHSSLISLLVGVFPITSIILGWALYGKKKYRPAVLGSLISLGLSFIIPLLILTIILIQYVRF